MQKYRGRLDSQREGPPSRRKRGSHTPRPGQASAGAVGGTLPDLDRGATASAGGQDTHMQAADSEQQTAPKWSLLFQLGLQEWQKTVASSERMANQTLKENTVKNRKLALY